MFIYPYRQTVFTKNNASIIQSFNWRKLGPPYLRRYEER